MNPAEMPVRPTNRVVGFLTILLVGAGVLYFLLWATGAYLITGDPLSKSDAIVVLSGGSDLERVDEAARLVKKRYAPVIILTETEKTWEELETGSSHSTQLKIQEAQAAGVPPKQILVTKGKAISTADEAEYILTLMREAGYQSAIIVTDPFHTRRAKILFQSEFANSGMSIIVQPVPGHWYRSPTWMFSVNGWRMTLNEYKKLLALWSLGIRGR
jgi:uncharacterized SAM-binding protein YcdF (DUF218 family)